MKINMIDSSKGRLKMLCRLLILVFFSCLCWTPTDCHVLQKRAAFYIANETMCIVDGDVYWNGDPVPTDDECERCTCRPPGFSCVLRDCDNKPGCKAVRRAGECCPEYVCGCVHNSRLYEDGELIKDLQNNCYTCRCHGSSISCTFADCRFRTDCPPEYIPGECCPRYDHCPFESITTLTTSTSTAASASSEIVQQELDFFNLTTQHVQKFTTEDITVKVEDITTSSFTTPDYTHTVKFTLSGEKITSIHDFDATELTTLLPLQTVSYKETTKHVLTSQEIESTTIKGGVIVGSIDETTETENTFDSKIETQTDLAPTDVIVSSDKISTSDFSDTSTKESFPESDVITVLTEDVSEWEEDFKTVQEAESSAIDSNSNEKEETKDFIQLVTDEITQQESSHVQTEVPVSNYTFEDLDHAHEITPGDVITTTVHSETSSRDETQTESVMGIKSATNLVFSTTIDDETITRNITEFTEEDIQSSSEVLHSVTSPETSESTTATTMQSVHTTSALTEHDDSPTTSITKLGHSSTTENSSLYTEHEIDFDSETTASLEETDMSSSDKFSISTDNDLENSEIHQDGETSNAPSHPGQFITTSEISDGQEIHISSHSTDNISETSHTHVDYTTERADLMKIEESQSVIDSSTTTGSHQFPSTYHATSTQETTHVEAVDETTLVKEIQASVDDLFSTPYYVDSAANNLSSTSYSSEEHNLTSDNDYSNEIARTTLYTTVEDVTLSSKTFEEFEKIDTSTSHTTDLDTDFFQSTQNSVSNGIDTSVIDKNQGSTVEFEVTEYEEEKELTNIFENNDLPSKADSDFSSANEDEEAEAEAESQEITTEPLSEKTSSLHSTYEETLDSEDTEINVQTDKGKAVTITMITEEEEIIDSQNNVQYNTTHDSLHTTHTSAESVTPEKDEHLTESFEQENANHVLTEEEFSVTSHSTENPTEILEILESDTKENISDLIIDKTGSPTDDLVYVMAVATKIDESSSQQTNASEFLLQSTTHEVTSDNKEETTSIKQNVESFTTSSAITTKTSEFIETTSKNLATEKISTTTEDDMPNELPAFEPPLANILKQHMLFNRPISQNEPTDIQNAKSNLPKETSDENKVEKSSLTVDETHENSLDESGNRILSFNQEYTIQDSEILSTIETTNKEMQGTSEENKDNLYFVKTENDDIIKTSGDDQTSTKSSFHEQSTSKIEDLSTTQIYEENNNASSSTEVMDSEEMHSEMIPKEENGLTNDSITTSLYETSIHVNFPIPDSENSSKLTETPIQLIDNSETNNAHQEESIVNVEKDDFTVENTPIINVDLDTPGHSTLVDVVNTQGHPDESLEVSTNTDELLDKDLSSSASSDIEKSSNLEDNDGETHPNFIYEDAESVENSNDRSTIQTSVSFDELPKYSITSQLGVTSSTDENESDSTSTESRPFSSDFNYTSVTSDSAKDEYLAALKFSTLYGQEFFTTLQNYQTLGSASSQTHSDLSSTFSSDNDAANDKTTTKDSSESVQYEVSTKKEQSHYYTEENTEPLSLEDFESKSEQYSSLTITPTDEENLPVSKDNSTSLNNFKTSFSTLSNLFSEVDISTIKDITAFATQEPSTETQEPSKLESSTSTETENLTQSLDETYGSRLKNEFAEYGVLGGVFITGKSKYQSNTSNEDDKNSSTTAHPTFSNIEVEQEINPVVENENIDHHNHSSDLEVENDAEADDSTIDLEFSTKYATQITFKNEEESELDFNSTKDENDESSEQEINLNFNVIPTVISSNDVKLMETVTNSETDPELKTTIMDTTNDETLLATRMSEETHSQTDLKDNDEELFSTKSEKGPEKGGDWFEPTDPNLILAGVDKKETDISTKPENADVTHSVSNESTADYGPEKGGEVFEPTIPNIFPINNEDVDKKDIISDTLSTVEDSDAIHIITNENTPEHGPEKGGEVFEPAFPDVFPINNANSGTGSDTTSSIDQTSTTKIIDLNNEETFNKHVTSIHSVVNKSKSDEVASTESNINFNFIPPMPILLKSLPKFIQPSYRINSETVKDVNDNENPNININHRYMSDEQNMEPSSKLLSDRNFNPSLDLSGIISKVFKAPGYDAEVQLRSLKDYPSINRDHVTRRKRDVEIPQATHSGSDTNDKLLSRLSEGLYPFNSKNILLVEGYGQKQSDFVPVTSSVIIVHSDDENETEIDDKQNESKDILFSELQHEKTYSNPEKDKTSSLLNKSHPKM